jgi:hypothetical protein
MLIERYLAASSVQSTNLVVTLHDYSLIGIARLAKSLSYTYHR